MRVWVAWDEKKAIGLRAGHKFIGPGNDAEGDLKVTCGKRSDLSVVGEKL